MIKLEDAQSYAASRVVPQPRHRRARLMKVGSIEEKAPLSAASAVPSTVAQDIDDDHHPGSPACTTAQARL